MSNYRRNKHAGATYFFTLCLNDRKSSLLTQHIQELRVAFKKTKLKKPFTTEAMVVLPDHLHALWTLPEDDADYTNRIRLFKSHFTRQLPNELKHTNNINRQKHNQTGIWQLRYWEHTIKNEQDFINHLNYIHYNPVKHGYVEYVKDWQYSTFHKYVNSGIYNENWGSDFMESKTDFGE